MLVINCVKNGKLGKKCGKSGTCYIGKDAVAKAAAQCRAIKVSQNK